MTGNDGLRSTTSASSKIDDDEGLALVPLASNTPLDSFFGGGLSMFNGLGGGFGAEGVSGTAGIDFGRVELSAGRSPGV
jgi:hypothetical protein